MEAIQKLHAQLITKGLYKQSFPISKVLLPYALSSSHLAHALLVFHQIEHPNTFIWNTMIRGFSHSGTPHTALHMFDEMRQRGVSQDNRTFPFLLKACAKIQAFKQGKKIHSHCMKFGFISDLFVANAFIHLYASCGDLDCARKLFVAVPDRDLVSWNSLISGYSQHNCLREVLSLFEAMQAEGTKGDKVTMVKVVSACTHLGNWSFAEAMIGYIKDNCIEVDVYLGNTLIDYYGRRGMVESARRVFDEMKEKNTMTMNAMIMAYAKAEDLVSARRIFDSMVNKDLISWSSMITGYSQVNQFSNALVLFREMQTANVMPDEIVIATVLSACAHLGALELGKWIHNYIRRNNINTDVYVGNSLIDMYSKCGSTLRAFKVFDEMKEKDTLSWNLIILGLANNGYVESALEIFSNMLREGFQPNDVTFLGTLVACANGGLVEKGIEYFQSMTKVHGVEPQKKHYGCVVDLLARSGELEKAHNFIIDMPVNPDPIVWRMLLAGCKVHGNVHLAEIAIKELIELDPSNSGNYVLLLNTYVTADRWNDAMEVREMMAETNMQKIPGCSSIELTASG